MEKLKDVAKKNNIYRLIDASTHTFIAKRTGAGAIAEYGEWWWTGSYTTGFTGNGGFEQDVWILRG